MKHLKLFEDYKYKGTIRVKLLGNNELWDASRSWINEFEISNIKYTILSHDSSKQVIYVATLKNTEYCQEIQVSMLNYKAFKGDLVMYSEVGSHLWEKEIELFQRLSGYFGYLNFCKLDSGTEVGNTDHRKWFEIVN